MPVNAKFTSVSAPSEASAGEYVRVEYSWHNYGDPGPSYVCVYDKATGDLIGGSGYGYMSKCSEGGGSVGFSMPNKDLTLVLKTGEGYACYDIRSVTDTREVTIKLRATPPPPTPSFAIDSINPPSLAGSAGASVSVTVGVRNKGNASGDCEVGISDHTNRVVARKTITVAAGQVGYATLTVTLPASAGTYTWYVYAYNKYLGVTDDSKPITVTVTAPAAPEIGRVDISAPQTAFVNQEVEIMATVTLKSPPDDSQAATYKIEEVLEVNGLVVEQRSSKLAAGYATYNFIHRRSFSSPGKYVLRAGARIVKLTGYVPLGQAEYVWSNPITVEVPEVVTPPTAPHKVPAVAYVLMAAGAAGLVLSPSLERYIPVERLLTRR